ncbi:MAG: hypothetical protein NPINA01_03930 [Nitrospinaceae bacterium]|nr:MAG: hypothetical protein NPINA01_03930 [Nitrospinaceae bacterium]
MEPEQGEEFRDEKKENLYRRISFWISLILATGVSIYYVTTTPPDTKEVQAMRMFFNAQKKDVGKFIRLPRDEQKAFAEKKKHPFYSQYLNASEVQKEKLRGLIHISFDYTPNQYWFNIVFLWTIFFTGFWFIGLMIEGAIILVRRDKAKRNAAKSSRG